MNDDSKSGLTPSAFLSLIRTSSSRAVVRRIRDGGKVVKVPCPDGSVKLVGIAPDGRWVAEWSCCIEDWRDSMVDRMERHVRHSRSVGIPRLSIV